MHRDNKDKVRLTQAMLMPQAPRGLVAVLEYGAEKYDSPAAEKDWLEYDPVEVADSLLRHAQSLCNGEVIDPESGLPHAFHMMFNAACYCEITTSYCSSGDSPEPKLPGGLTGR